MKIDLNQSILDRGGKEITSKVKIPFVTTNEEGEVVEEQRYKAVTLTLGKALVDAVLTNSSMGENLEEKLERYNLFLKIEKHGEVDLSEEDINKLKIYVADRYEVLFVGKIVEMLS